MTIYVKPQKHSKLKNMKYFLSISFIICISIISYSLYPKMRAKYIENEAFIIDSIYFKQKFILDSIEKAAWYSFYKEELKKDSFNIIENMEKKYPIQSEAFSHAWQPYEEEIQKNYEKELNNIRERVKRGPKKGIKNAYINFIFKTILTVKERFHLVFAEYFLYDITKDGKPELFIIEGSCCADTELLIYTYKNGKMKLIYKDNEAAYYNYYKRKNYILITGQHQGTAYWYKLTYNNRKIKKKKIFEENTWILDENGDGYDRDYTQPPGTLIERFSCMDTIPICELK